MGLGESGRGKTGIRAEYFLPENKRVEVDEGTTLMESPEKTEVPFGGLLSMALADILMCRKRKKMEGKGGYHEKDV